MPDICPVCEGFPSAAPTGREPAPQGEPCPGCNRLLAIDLSEPAIPAPPIALAVASERARPEKAEYYFEASARKAPPLPPRARRAPGGLFCASLATAACMAIFAGRASLARIAPWTAGAFAAAGFPINLRGLEMRHVQSKILEDGGQRVLVVDGEIANIRPSSAKVPDIQVAVRASDGRTVYSWTSPAPKRDIAQGETVYFRARLAAPPPEGQDVKLQFASLAPEVPSKAKK